MKRRKFIKGTIGFGLLALPGLETFSQSAELSTSLNIANIISFGDIHRKSPPVANTPWVLLYQGNGRLGSCFGPWGLHADPNQKTVYNMHGSTRFTHIKHFIRGKFNADYLLPVGHITWETEPQKVTNYQQHQSFYDGTVTTRFTANDHAITLVSWFDAVHKDIAGFQIDVKGNCPAIIISTPRLISLNYDQQLVASVEEKLNKDLWHADIKCLNASSTMNVRSNARMKQVKEGLHLTLKPGRNVILIAINGDVKTTPQQSLKQTKTWWHDTWKTRGWLHVPDETVQKVWVRSLAYTLYSHNDDGFGCSPPTGLAGNAWPFPFPFDSGCRHLLLLMTGQTDAARKWIEFWHSRFDGLKDYTQRHFKSDGIFLPHVFPYGQAFNYHDPDVPNKYYYPIYNSALMVRLADQTAVMVNDPRWTKTYAEPLIREGAKFYLAHLQKGVDDLWHLHVIPSISLDESGDINKPDYVSGLISAQYSLQKAVEYGLDTDHRMQDILEDGLGYKPLLAENGMYHNHLGAEMKDFGKQKHPDQLFAINHTPLGPNLSEPHRMAHEFRYETTEGARAFRFIGHTLGEFILASARMHDVDAWKKDWSMMMPAKYTDPDLIQFYESTGNNLAFYVTTHGLFAQAILETIVSTWWGQLDLGSCIPWKDTVRFGNIRTLLGVTVSGEIKDGSGHATLHAWKDTSFKYHGEEITLKKGQQVRVKVVSRQS